jgi:hypothetical protein
MMIVSSEIIRAIYLVHCVLTDYLVAFAIGNPFALNEWPEACFIFYS